MAKIDDSIAFGSNVLGRLYEHGTFPSTYIMESDTINPIFCSKSVENET